MYLKRRLLLQLQVKYGIVLNLNFLKSSLKVYMKKEGSMLLKEEHMIIIQGNIKIHIKEKIEIHGIV